MNLETISMTALIGINNLDKTFIGTEDYMGRAYFWNYKYRHYLRDTSDYRRRLVHKHFINAGLPLDGESAEHLAIIRRILHTQ